MIRDGLEEAPPLHHSSSFTYDEVMRFPASTILDAQILDVQFLHVSSNIYNIVDHS